jgi:hypothetical protein
MAQGAVLVSGTCFHIGLRRAGLFMYLNLYRALTNVDDACLSSPPKYCYLTFVYTTQTDGVR